MLPPEVNGFSMNGLMTAERPSRAAAVDATPRSANARPRLERAKATLPLAELEGDRLAIAIAEIDKLLVSL